MESVNPLLLYSIIPLPVVIFVRITLIYITNPSINCYDDYIIFLSKEAERRKESKHTFTSFVILTFLLPLPAVFSYSHGFLCSDIA